MIKVDAHIDFALGCVDVLAAGPGGARILYYLPTTARNPVSGQQLQWCSVGAKQSAVAEAA